MLDLRKFHADVTRLVDVSDDPKNPQYYPRLRSALAYRVVHSMSPAEREAVLERLAEEGELAEIALFKAAYDALDFIVPEQLGLMGELERTATGPTLKAAREAVFAGLVKAKPRLEESDPPPARA